MLTTTNSIIELFWEEFSSRKQGLYIQQSTSPDLEIVVYTK